MSHLEIFRASFHLCRILFSEDSCTASELQAILSRGMARQTLCGSSAKPYWVVRGELTLGEDLLLRAGRIVVPESLQTQTLQKLHQ